MIKAEIDTQKLEATAWAKEFKVRSPISYSEALLLALNPKLRVEIVQTDEGGDREWAIDAGELAPGFWMDVKPTKKEALALCKLMEWKRAR